jgi:hypothetical protein
MLFNLIKFIFLFNKFEIIEIYFSFFFIYSIVNYFIKFNFYKKNGKKRKK